MRLLRHFSSQRLPRSFQNAAGIFHLQNDLQSVAFGHSNRPNVGNADHKADPNESHLELLTRLEKLSLKHLDRCGLLNQETVPSVDINLDLPTLLADDLDKHFQKIGNRMLHPYIQMCQKFIAQVKEQQIRYNSPISGKQLVNHVSDWQIKSGWVKYTSSGSEPVKYPADEVIVFDTEVLYNQHEYAVMATAVSADALYVWLSPWLLGESTYPEHLIPLGLHKQVVIGHHVGFDRKRVKEEYRLAASPKWYMDTMAFHIVVSGMCNQQRATFLKYESLQRQLKDEETSSSFSHRISKSLAAMVRQEPWLEYTCANGLADTVKFYLGENVDKSDRDLFGELTREETIEPDMLRKLIRYCAMDSVYTRDLFAELLPKFREFNPHPVSLAALKEISNVFLPVNSSWDDYVSRSEKLFEDMQHSVRAKLEALAEDAVSNADDPEKLEYVRNHDPWLSQLDWTIKPIRYTKARPGHPSRPMKNQKLPGKPQWYRDLYTSKENAMNLTSRSRTTTILLRLKWDRLPLVWFDSLGWSFWAPKEMKKYYENLNFAHIRDENGQSLFKLPHPDGSKGRCTNPLAKFYLSFFESGTLSSENTLAKETIDANLTSSYWVSSRKRIMTQMAVFPPNQPGDHSITAEFMGLPPDWGMILPRMIPMGAVTRRAVEDTWLTASNAKKNRIGSELKCNVRAPPGYKIIGADVDSEELWIAGVIGDSVFKMHGGTAFGWMTLEGSKKNGTDLHSKSAQILGINRNEAKVFNYGRIYGSGEKSAVRSLRQFNPELSIQEAEEKAAALYTSTKGAKTKTKVFPLTNYWRGGTESVMYNQLEMLAELPRQQTPVLGAGISNALSSRNLNQNSFMTTRVNWSIQSSGVDYLHLLIASMRYLCDVYKIEARLMLTVHDELRYLVTDSDALRAGIALQIANLWTRGMFCQQLGLESVPQSVAFFSNVDFDTVLRKEVDDPCITPTQTEKLPFGEALDMPTLVEHCSSLGNPDQDCLKEYESQLVKPREPVMAKINDSPLLADYVQAQIGTADEAADIEQQLRKRKQSQRPNAKARKNGFSAETTKDTSNNGLMQVMRVRPRVPRYF